MAFYDKVDVSKKNRLGIRRKDYAGNEYIYGKGVASNAVGAWVALDNLFAPTLTVANVKGVVGVSMAANTSATNFSWYCIYGLVTGKVVTGATGAKVWVTATPGSVDNTDVATDLVVGAIQRSATASNLATFHLNYPMCLNEVYN